MESRICVVIVTYNRLDKLKNALLSYSYQTKKPDMFVILDNNSNDGSVEFLKKWEEENGQRFDIEVIYSRVNEGGAGGFNKALECALSKECDWIWISDDDAYPQRDAFEVLSKRISLSNEKTGAICSVVLQGGEIALRHRRRMKKSIFIGLKEKCVNKKEYINDVFGLNLYTFVGTCIRKDVLREVGLPHKDYFIWYDDTEHSMRVNEKYEIICDPRIVVVHDIPVSKKEKTWKGYYANRNRLDAYYRHLPVANFRMYNLYYRIQLFVYFLIDKRTYKIKTNALSDFKNNIMGMSDNYKPGTKV